MKVHPGSLALGIVFCAALICTTRSGLEGAAEEHSNLQRVKFNRDIRPILSDKCFTCHGPDKANRMTALHFDTEEGAFQELASGGFAIVRGDPSKSVMFQRISSDNPAIRMPPAYLDHDRLSDREINLFQAWIEQGAPWQKHWSFIPPKRPPVPAVRNREQVRDPIDHFVLARLEREGLTFSPEAGPTTLIRRVTLDLTGLPPTRAEVDAFVNDESPDAYEKMVDRLLQSPRYGERMAARWLDAARYADTNGYQFDGVRSMWRWRDWVIGAFNRNMPFDRFTIEQIAGDMLPTPTREQIIATGFNRNHRTNAEGGIIDEEFRVEYVADRVETTSTVWLGLTVGCARCHDHKFDPIKQKEFYQFFAYFNNVPEKGFVLNFGNEEPYIKAPTPEQEERLKELEEEVTAAREQYASLLEGISDKQRVWEKWVRTSGIPDWSVGEGLRLHFPLDGSLQESTGVYEETISAGTFPASSGVKEKEEIEALKKPFVGGSSDGKLPFVSGKIGQAGGFDGKRYVEGDKVAHFNYMDPFTLAAWIYPTSPNGAIVSSVEDLRKGQGYGLYLRKGKVRFNYTFRWEDLGMRMESEEALPLNRWHHVLLTYDGKRKSKGVKLYLNGRERRMKVLFDVQNWPIALKVPLRIGAGEGPEDRFQGTIDEVRVYERALSAEEAAVVALAETVSEIAAMPRKGRTPAQRNKVAFCFLDRYAPEAVQRAARELRDAERDRREFFEAIPTVMVMKESETPRDAFVLKRGAYDAHGEKVTAGVPEALFLNGKQQPADRLALARWLVDPANPLTARVTVNRFWQMFFGVGLVKTTENFGSQGDWPVHPDVLDWLATEFIESGWDVKGILKTMVMSATYRQSSKVTPELLQKDPENRLLGRAPRFRLPAEVIRDQALALSGLLVEQIGGPSVKPYQPPGLWKEIAAGGEYRADKGEKLYRRSLYTYWRRTVAPPGMVTFDATDRETCTVRLGRTNTPLQALNLMNDVTYLEASRKLAERMMKEGGRTPEERIDYAFRLATARPLKQREGDVFLDAFRKFEQSYIAAPEKALQVLGQGESPRDEALDPVELASYTAVASVILNLDETITKE